MIYRLVIATVVTWLLFHGVSFADKTEPTKPDPSILSVERIYGEQEFSAKGYSAKWIDGKNSYFRLEDSHD